MKTEYALFPHNIAQINQCGDNLGNCRSDGCPRNSKIQHIYAVTYTRIYITFSIFNVFNVTMNNIVSSEGAAKTAMCALLAGAVLNVGLDPVFIYVLDLGVAGAPGQK